MSDEFEIYIIYTQDSALGMLDGFEDAYPEYYFNFVKSELFGDKQYDGECWWFNNRTKREGRDGQCGYHYMIKWWLQDVFNEPALSHLKYYMRLDSDSEFYGDVPNVFDKMKNESLAYLSNYKVRDCFRTVQGIFQTAKKYLNGKESSIRTKIWEEIESQENHDCENGFQNNLEVVDMDRFREEEVMKFSQYMIDSEGIYKHRWGDAVLRRYELGILFEDEDIADLPKRWFYHHHFEDDNLEQQK